MRATGVLLVSSVVLAVLGVGLSYTGYNGNAQTGTMTRTVTTTQSTVVRSTVITGTSVELSIVWTATTKSLEQSFNVANICYDCCGIYDSATAELESGKLHISYHSVIAPTPTATGIAPIIGPDFLIMNPNQYQQWVTKGTCFELSQTPAVAKIFNRPSYEGIVDVPSNGTYYLVVVNRIKDSGVSVTVDLWHDAPQTLVTVTHLHPLWGTSTLTEYSTTYSTYLSTYTVEASQAGTAPYVAYILFVAAVGMLLGAVYVRRAGRSKQKATGEPAGFAPSKIASQQSTKAVALSPTSPLHTKFCQSCGAKILGSSVYCQECGTRL